MSEFKDIPIDVGVVYEGERVRRADMQVELGGPNIEQKFELAKARKIDEVEDGKITIIGPDLKDITEGSSIPFGIIIEVAGKQIEEDLEGVIERRIHEYTNYLEGVMHLNQRYDIWIRISKKSFKKGFNTFEHMGKVLQTLFKSELPIIERIQVTFITDPDEVKKRHTKALDIYNARDAKARGLEDEKVDAFYGCTLCQSFAPTHCCVITPQRYSNCGAISWFDGRAAARVDPKGPLFTIEKGELLDSFTGEYSGVNQVMKEKTLGSIDKITLYSAFVYPHTSCGCFEAIGFYIPEVDGLGIVHRDFKGEAVNGLPFSTMADSTAGGRQIEGFHGLSIEYMRSPKFLQVDDGWNRVVWMPQAVKDRVKEFIPTDIVDKIPTENDAKSIEELKAFLESKNHPVVERWAALAPAEEVAEAIEKAETTSDPFAAELSTASGTPVISAGVPTSGGFRITLKNVKIKAEKVIIKRKE
ncbi:MAG: CO dehydrogenase/CO-methylating acetyl-CoA synthase complex subunit beta [Candidatus Hodarchaeota archaeon]